MNSPSSKPETTCCSWLPWTVGIVGTLLIGAVIVKLMIVYTTPPPLGEDRVQTRLKNLREIRAAEAEAVQQYGWVDQARGVVRLPVQRAIELTAKEWQNPAAARANLIARVEKATEKLPEPKSAFE